MASNQGIRLYNLGIKPVKEGLDGTEVPTILLAGTTAFECPEIGGYVDILPQGFAKVTNESERQRRLALLEIQVEQLIDNSRVNGISALSRKPVVVQAVSAEARLAQIEETMKKLATEKERLNGSTSSKSTSATGKSTAGAGNLVG